LPDLPYLQSKKAGWNQEKSKNKSQESNLEHLVIGKVGKNNLIGILLIWLGCKTKKPSQRKAFSDA
jgi:hypothetical protein